MFTHDILLQLYNIKIAFSEVFNSLRKCLKVVQTSVLIASQTYRIKKLHLISQPNFPHFTLFYCIIK